MNLPFAVILFIPYTVCMKKRFSIAVALALVCAAQLCALEVSLKELTGASTEEIYFKSYTGPVTVFNTMAQIRNIGTLLGNSIANGNNTAQDGEKYSVIHAVDDSESTLLDADILILGKNAGVDHIRNLRAIISAYLVASYGYSREDGDTLATFITVYNAVYRGKLAVFESNYKPIVAGYLQADKVGLSTDYADWPGATQIVIPLTGRERGSLSTVDTTVISDPNVVESMREENDKGIDVRTDMADLKNREAEEASANAQEAAKEAASAQGDVQSAKTDAEKAKEDAKKAEGEAQKSQEMADKIAEIAANNPNDKSSQEAAQKADQVAKEKAEEAQKAQEAQKDAEQKLADARDKAADAQKKATDEQTFADKKKLEAQADTNAINRDKAAEIADKLVNIAHGLVISDEQSNLSALVMLDSKTGDLLKTSSVNVIRGRSVYQSGTNFVAIAGKTGGNAAIRLALIDGLSLEMTKQSNEPVSENAVLGYFDGHYFTVINVENKWVIGKYTSDLTLVASSDIEVNAQTPITAGANGVLIVDEDNKPRLLTIDTLHAVN